MTPHPSPASTVAVEVHYCVPDHFEKHLPKRRRAPVVIPASVPLPRQGDVIYLSSSSAWGVTLVIHEWRSPNELRIELWLEYVHHARERRQTDFGTTQ